MSSSSGPTASCTVFLPSLVNYPGRLCINRMWPALFSCISHRHLRAVTYASRRYWPHYRWCVHGMSVTRWSAGSTYTRVLNFGRFFSLKVRGSTCMRIALYAGIYGNLLPVKAECCSAAGNYLHLKSETITKKQHWKRVKINVKVAHLNISRIQSTGVFFKVLAEISALYSTTNTSLACCHTMVHYTVFHNYGTP